MKILIKQFAFGAICLVTLGLFAPNALAQDGCTFDVEVGDGLSYSVGDTMEASADCAEITINLKHTGTLPKEGMGHNWVLTETSEFQSVAQAGMSAGIPGNYVPADDARVLAATDLIGGGESTSITFSTENLDPAGDYTFFCSFPGHWAVMQGKFKFG